MQQSDIATIYRGYGEASAASAHNRWCRSTRCTPCAFGCVGEVSEWCNGCRLLGTNRTSQAGLTMSVDRGEADILQRRGL